MWILASERERRRRDDAILADRTRGLLRAALARHIPGTVVWVYGSVVKPGRFHSWSDVDVSLESLPADERRRGSVPARPINPKARVR
jgi:predicted nucleotidyltransferase